MHLPIVLMTLLLLMAGAAAEGADPREVMLGRQIAEADALGPDLACSRCHGALGTGRPAERAPRLAAQPRLYLLKQLEDFAAGERRSEKMAPVARALNEEQRQAVAAYYASLSNVPYPPQPPADPIMVQRGGVLGAIGDAERGIQACEICHADAGVGFPPSFPYLAGQHPDYLARQLVLWKRGERRNDPLNVMAEIARALSEEEIEALSLYYARIRPPPDAVSSLVPTAPVPPPPASPGLPE